jgi:hypothetical protein
MVRNVAASKTQTREKLTFDNFGGLKELALALQNFKKAEVVRTSYRVRGLDRKTLQTFLYDSIAKSVASGNGKTEEMRLFG